MSKQITSSAVQKASKNETGQTKIEAQFERFEAQFERFEACLERPQPSLTSALLSLLLSSSIKQLKLSTPLHYILFVLYTSRSSQS